MEKRCMSLMKINEEGRVRRINDSSDMRRRFVDIGIFEGARVRKIGTSPLGDPSAYMVSGVLVAIRDREAARIELE